MILYINTIEGHNIEIALKNSIGDILIHKKLQAKYRQAEKLLPEIDKMLKKKNISLNKLKSIEVENEGIINFLKEFRTSFTALRIGVVTANALGYSLGIPVYEAKEKDRVKKINRFSIKPIYNKEPNIT